MIISIVDEIEKLWAKVQSPWGALLVTFAVVFILTGKHLKREEPGARRDLPLRRWLQDGGLSGFYQARLTAILDGLDKWLVPAEIRLGYASDAVLPEPLAATNWRWSWNWLAYDRVLLLAITYPIIAPFAFWVVAGAPATLGGVEIVGQPTADWQRWVFGGLLILVLFNGPIARGILQRLGRPVDMTTRRADPSIQPGGSETVLRVVLVSCALALALTFALTFADVGVLAFALTFAFALAFALAVTLAGAFAFAVAFAVEGVLTVEGILTIAIAFALVSVVEKRIEKRAAPLTALMIFSIFGFAVLLAAARVAQEWQNDEARTVFLFLGVFPIVNAVFDFGSLGLTRFCLRQSLEGAAVRLAGVDVKPLKWWVIDTVGAVAALLGLCAALVLVVAGVNGLAAAPVMDMAQLFADMRPGSGVDMRWLYLMVFSTLLPTVAHFALFWVSIPMRFPGHWGREVLAGWIKQGKDGDDRTTIVQVVVAFGATMWMAIPVGMWVYWPHLGVWHGAVVQWFVTVFEGFARAVDPAWGVAIG